MKRKLFLMAITAISFCVIAACGSKAGSNNANADQVAAADGSDSDELDEDDENAPKTEAGVTDMLNQLYDDINIIYTPRGEDDLEPNIDIFAQYCSSAFNTLREQVMAIDFELDDEEKFFDDWDQLFSFWDEAPMVPTDISVDVEGDTAQVFYELNHGSESATFELQVVYENGQWHVNDILQRGLDGLSKLEQMRTFIEERKDTAE